jgi:hypothetical protein
MEKKQEPAKLWLRRLVLIYSYTGPSDGSSNPPSADEPKAHGEGEAPEPPPEMAYVGVC